MNDVSPEHGLVRRVNRIMAVLAVAGIAVAGVYWGVAGALGFAAGAVVSFLNFRWLAGLALALGPREGEARRPWSTVFLALRYLIFAGVGYVIFRYSEVGFLAALAGCCIQIAAVILEVIYELTYAGTS
ncbi:MAG TPA: ATP synthase subunit I [Verrucomicrobiae bacterium]|nr:ATP synthase subunit I [Verrucomicrobiae bacterium]